MEIVKRLVPLNKMEKRGALRLTNKNITPLMYPRFSIGAQSAKQAKHEGMPNPNKNPQVEKMIKA